MSKNVRCSECRHQMTGWDGGFFGEPVTCECRIHGVTEGRKSCSKFKKRITKSDLLNKIQSLEKENEQLKAKASSWKITCSQESNEKNVLFMKNRQLQEENEHQKEEIVNSHKAYVECLNENKELKKENEQLKTDLYIVETDCKNVKESREHYRQENKQLRKKLEHIYSFKGQNCRCGGYDE